MEYRDLKTILSQMQAFEIPGFSQLLKDLKDPLVSTHFKAKMKSIDHNITLLKDRLQTMQSVFKVQPDEVNRYMANPHHFSEQEQKVIANVEQELHSYWKKMSVDLMDQNQGVKKKISPRTDEKRADKPTSKPRGGRKGWLAS